jgi:hypothetical protein
MRRRNVDDSGEVVQDVGINKQDRQGAYLLPGPDDAFASWFGGRCKVVSCGVPSV